MLPRNSMHYSHTVKINTINCSLSMITIPMKGIRLSILVGSDPATHLTVWSSTDREED